MKSLFDLTETELADIVNALLNEAYGPHFKTRAHRDGLGRPYLKYQLFHGSPYEEPVSAEYDYVFLIQGRKHPVSLHEMRVLDDIGWWDSAYVMSVSGFQEEASSFSVAPAQVLHGQYKRPIHLCDLIGLAEWISRYPAVGKRFNLNIPAELYECKAQDNSTALVIADCQIVNRELLAHLAKHPNAVYQLNSRRFEELIAQIVSDMGYQVILTPQTRDGGIDIRAVHRTDLGNFLFLIECKRLEPNGRVSVDVVRQVYGVAQAERASCGIVVTSSYFTKPALAFQRSVGHQLSLRDYQGLKEWLGKYSSRS